jgi:hypothetical protein
MPQALRRQYLIGIFSSRFPETRARNLEFTLHQCAQYAARLPSAHQANVET